MEAQESIHFEIEGVLTPNNIACTRTPVPLSNLPTTANLDETTCPMCQTAMIHRAMIHMSGSHPRAK